MSRKSQIGFENGMCIMILRSGALKVWSDSFVAPDGAVELGVIQTESGTYSSVTEAGARVVTFLLCF